MEKIIITKKDGHQISCLQEIPEASKGILLAIHGFTSSKECSTYQLLFRRMPPEGIGVFGIDLPGHGKEESREETLSIHAALASIEAAEEYIVSRYPGLPVYYFASSFGAYLTGTYISTREHTGRKAFFRSAAVNMPSLFIKDDPTEKEKQQLKDLEEKGYFYANMEDSDSVCVTQELFDELGKTDLFEIFDAGRFGEHRIMMAHGEEDQVIDPEKAKLFAEKFEIPVIMFEKEGHSLSLDPSTPDRVADLALSLYTS